MKIALFVLAASFLISACEQPKASKRVEPTDNKRVQSTWYYIQFELPNSFTMDPASYQGEEKWWCKFDDPETGLTVEACSYGFIGDSALLMTAPGWNEENYDEKLERDGRDIEKIIMEDSICKNPESYFLDKVLPAESEKKEFPFYDRYLHREDNKVMVFFFDKASKDRHDGPSYEWMLFTCRNGALAGHEELVTKIVDSAKPWLSRDKSEQDIAPNDR